MTNPWSRGGDYIHFLGIWGGGGVESFIIRWGAEVF